MKLIGTIQPFVGMQTIHLYDNENKEQEYRLASLNDYAQVVLGMVEEYPDITELNLHGATPFCEKIKTEIESNSFTKYDNSKRIEVNII